MGVCSVAQLCLILWDPIDYSPPGSSVHGDSPGKNTGVGAFPDGPVVKHPSVNAGDADSIPGPVRSHMTQSN